MAPESSQSMTAQARAGATVGSGGTGAGTAAGHRGAARHVAGRQASLSVWREGTGHADGNRWRPWPVAVAARPPSAPSSHRRQADRRPARTRRVPPGRGTVPASEDQPGVRDSVKFGINYNTGYYGTDPGNIAAVARHAEGLRLRVVLLLRAHRALPRGEDGHDRVPAVPCDRGSAGVPELHRRRHRADPAGTAVLLLPYQHPVVLAKRLATLDALSKGRMRLLTVGVGTLPGEARAVGVDFTSRGRRADEAIDVMRLLWAGGDDGVSFEGEFFFFQKLCSFPKPFSAGTLPVHVGGSSRAAARRAGRRGDGYFPGGRLTSAERAAQIGIMRAAAVEAGRDPEALEYTRWGSIDMSAADVEHYAEDGVTRLVVAPAALDVDEQCAQISAFAERLRLG